MAPTNSAAECQEAHLSQHALRFHSPHRPDSSSSSPQSQDGDFRCLAHRQWVRAWSTDRLSVAVLRRRRPRLDQASGQPSRDHFKAASLALPWCTPGTVASRKRPFLPVRLLRLYLPKLLKELLLSTLACDGLPPRSASSKPSAPRGMPRGGWVRFPSAVAAFGWRPSVPSRPHGTR